MAYSDYGGYAYRNGKRVKERSDVTIMVGGPDGHVVLGDGPVYLELFKSGATLYLGTERQDLPINRYGSDEIRRSKELEGCKVEVVYTHEDNFYVYARLTQPDGNVWHGWSGYGVGAGLEDAGYGYSTEDRNDTLRELWPESIAA